MRTPRLANSENHRFAHMGWLRASVLGANDGVLSTGSLVVGVASAGATLHTIFVTGIAGLTAGALSMAAGEFVSVSSQADTEKADLRLEKRELETDPESEIQELIEIYMKRGLERSVATQVAIQFTAHDALGTHARDELGITNELRARPVQAAIASAASFTVGAAVPLLLMVFFTPTNLAVGVSVFSVLFLMLLGAFAAKMGGASAVIGAARVGFWGAFAMSATAIIGSLLKVRG